MLKPYIWLFFIVVLHSKLSTPSLCRKTTTQPKNKIDKGQMEAEQE